MALVAGVLAAWGDLGTITLGALVGFFTVPGIAARNGILLIAHFRHLEQVEGEPFGPALVVRGASERLSPILMTAPATALALAPLVIYGNKPGQEIEYPTAVVILGGLATSTLLNLFVLPALYLRVAGWKGPYPGFLLLSGREGWRAVLVVSAPVPASCCYQAERLAIFT
jgi:Cu/Ag efflux pump CusA